MARRDPEALLEASRAERQEQARELDRLRRELELSQQLTHDLEADVAQGDALVRWLLRDQDISGLDLRVRPGSRHDLDMMKRLVTVMEGIDPAEPVTFMAVAEHGTRTTGGELIVGQARRLSEDPEL